MQSLTPISHFRNRHKGESVAILANGASLLEHRGERLWAGPTIGINKTWLIHRSRYHCIIDKRQLEAALKAKGLLARAVEHCRQA